ncbi:MAG TPA: aminotransferase class IV [Candidatus Paceibacterota bacterium]|jgi:Branched-chain amino acid aminotransferase/4-amino-4-deoxychorismate lyase
MAEIYPKAYFGGSIVSIDDAKLSVACSAVLYGLSVYTVLPVVRTKKGMAAFRLEDHYARLINSAKVIGIDSFEKDFDLKKFKAAVVSVVSVNKINATAFIRATVHVSALVPGTRSRGLPTTLSIFAYEANPIITQSGARLKTSVWRRVPDYAIPSRAKVNGAYVNSVLGKQDAIDSGYDDCLFLDAQGHICELSAANIFIVRDGALITPDRASDILEGINRKTVIELARQLKIPVIERLIDLTELYVADEAFACGTSAFVAPIIEVDTRKIGAGKEGAITKKIREAHAKLLRGDGPAAARLLTILK